MIEKLVIHSIGDNAHQASVLSLTRIKINEIIDAVNGINDIIRGYNEIIVKVHDMRVHSKPVGALAKLEMHKATLQDLEEEIRKGSI